MAQKKLGSILVEQGALREEDLKKALEFQKTEGGLIGEILVRLQMVSEEEVVVALASQFGYPYLPIENFTINPEVANLVPTETIMKYTFLPIDRINNILTVVMADPSNDEVIKEIEEISKCKLQAFVSTVSEIEKTIKRQYKILTIERKTTEEKLKLSFQAARSAKKETEPK